MAKSKKSSSAKSKKNSSVKKAKEPITELPQIPFYTPEPVLKEEPVLEYIQPIDEVKETEDFSFDDEKKNFETVECCELENDIIHEEPNDEGWFKKNKKSLLVIVGTIAIIIMSVWTISDIKKPEQELVTPTDTTSVVENVEVVQVDTVKYITVINEVTDSLVKTNVKLQTTTKELKKTKKELKKTKKELKETDHYANFVFENYKKALFILLDSNNVIKQKLDTVLVSRPGE
jgi:hypothetical protein